MKIRRCCALVALLWILDVSVAEAQCTYTVSTASVAVGSLATSRTISIITGTQCSWTATSAVSWITISSGATGIGMGSVTFLVAQNSTTSPRTGTLTVAGQTVTVTQGVGSCTYSVLPTSFAVASLASSRTISIITGTQCSWTATSGVSWITIASGATGIGMGPVTFLIEQSPITSSRTGTLTVAGQTVTVTQEAGSCTYSVSTTSFSIGALATSRTISIIAGTLCPWTATSAASWITVTDGATGSGLGPVTFSIAANASAGARTGTLAVAGQSVTVNQAGSFGGLQPPAAPTNLRIVH